MNFRDGSNLNFGDADLLKNDGNKYFLSYYTPREKSEVNNALVEFKNKHSKAIHQWVNIVESIASLLPKVECVVRAKGHNEIGTDSTPLDKIGLVVSNAKNSNYIPDILVKKVTRKSVGLSRDERYAEIHDAYQLTSSGREKIQRSKSVLILDDVVTSGATTSEISRCLHAENPNLVVYIFSLCRTFTPGYVAEVRSQNNNFLRFYHSTEYPKFHAKRNLNSSFSSSYTATGRTFVIQNLPMKSIVARGGFKHYSQAIAVVKNILNRGEPTLMSRYLRKEIGDLDVRKDILTPFPLISHHNESWLRTIKGSASGFNPARMFYDELIEEHLGKYSFIKKLLIPEVSVSQISDSTATEHADSIIDFYLPQAQLAIEIDGQQHKDIQKDKSRDAYLSRNGITTIRIPVKDLIGKSALFIQCCKEIVLQIENSIQLTRKRKSSGELCVGLDDYKRSYELNIDYADGKYKAAAVIRLQILVLELLEREVLSFCGEWRFQFLLHDVKAFIQPAFIDIRLWLTHLLSLLNVPISLPPFSYELVSSTDEFDHANYICVDFSITRRFTDTAQNTPLTYVIRSHYLDEYPVFENQTVSTSAVKQFAKITFSRFSTEGPVEYKLTLDKEERHHGDLLYMLENIFLPFTNKVEFREGQLPIIASALMRNNTIGLLPTGSGKSVCFQLCILLQPSLSFVVSPIKALMSDQKADLDAVLINKTDFLNSDLSPLQQNEVLSRYASGKCLFIYVSPERFQIQKFREVISEIYNQKSFAYAVIDEAHCLSEWGHDFRTSYLNLSRAINRFAPQAKYLGVTATASINVLKDLAIEFDVDEIDIKSPSSFTRDELRFDVIDDKGSKASALMSLLEKLDQKWNFFQAKGKDARAGIVFTNAVNGPNGCFPLANSIASKFQQKVGFFSGSKPKEHSVSPIEFNEGKQETQRRFKENELSLIVATKAFGMGVNKGNVSFTAHYGIPGSLESLYQEAGRAGRQKELFQGNKADCYILITPERDNGQLQELWRDDISVNEIEKFTKSKLTRNGDLNSSLYFLTSSTDTINNDLKLILKIYNEYYDPNNLTLEIGQNEVGGNQSHVEKAIYRLSQMGVVRDWTVSFQRGRSNRYLVEFQKHTEKNIHDAVETYIRRYEPGFSIAKVLKHPIGKYEYASDSKKSRIYVYSLIFLIWGFDHFFYNRKQSLKNVYDNCLSFTEGKITSEDFKLTMESYFRIDTKTHQLQAIADDPFVPDNWLRFLFEDASQAQLLDIPKLRKVRDQLSRFLESYQNNIGLNSLSGLIRLLLDDFENADGKARLELAMARASKMGFDDQEIYLSEILSFGLKLSVNQRDLLAECAFEKLGSVHLAKIYEVLGDNYTLNIYCDRARSELKQVNDKLGENW